MKNLEQLQPYLDALPVDIKANAEELLAKMSSTIEGIGDEPVEWRTPLLKLFQAVSSREGLPRGVAPGDLILGEQVMEAPMNFIPLRMNEGRQMWDPNPAERRLLCQSPDAKLGQIGVACSTCRHSQWVEGQGSDCNKIISAIGITADLKEIFSVNFSKSQYSIGRDFMGTLRKAGVAPYQRVYGLSSETSPKTKTIEQFKIEALAADKRRTADELIPFLKALFDLIGADRKDLLTMFYKSIEDRRAAGTLPLGVAGAPAQLEDASAGDATLALPAEAGETVTAKVSPKAKGYSV